MKETTKAVTRTKMQWRLMDKGLSVRPVPGRKKWHIVWYEVTSQADVFRYGVHCANSDKDYRVVCNDAALRSSGGMYLEWCPAFPEGESACQERTNRM